MSEKIGGCQWLNDKVILLLNRESINIAIIVLAKGPNQGRPSPWLDSIGFGQHPFVWHRKTTPFASVNAFGRLDCLHKDW